MTAPPSEPSAPDEIVVHHLELSRSSRLVWALEELELPYRIQHYKRHPKTSRAPAELEALHPLGKAPMLSVDGHVLAESGAILEYLVEREGKLGPSDPEAKLLYRYWMHYAEGTLMPPLLVALIMNKVKTAPMPFFIKPIAKGIVAKVKESYFGPEITKNFDFVEAHLGQHDYFAGAEFSAADIQMSYPIEAGLDRGDGAARPSCQAWLARVRARPAYQRAVDKGGPVGVPGRSA